MERRSARGHSSAAWCVAFYVVAAIAGASTATRAQVADPDFPITNGYVRTEALVGGVLYIGGWFDRVGCQYTGGSASIDPATGEGRPGWPEVDGAVFAMIGDGKDGWYIGGAFSRVAGLPRANLAHIRADGSLGEWNPGTNWNVSALCVRDSVVYVGGTFSLIGGQHRGGLAAVRAVTGEVLPWNPGEASGVVAGLVLDGETLYLAGYFSAVGGTARQHLAAVHALTGELLPWDPKADAPVKVLALRDSVLFVGGNFTTLGGEPRPYLGALDIRTGLPLDWTPGASTTVHSFAFDDSTLYVGGSFVQIGGRPQVALAAFRLPSLELLPWIPDPNGYVAALTVRDGLLYAGGDFFQVGSHQRNHLAAFALPSGALLDWDPNANDDVLELVADASGVHAGGVFAMLGGLARSGLAAIDAGSGTVLDWSPVPNGPVHRLTSFGSELYAAGDFTQMNGLPLANLARFDAPSGDLLPWDAHLGSKVNCLAASASTLYLGGAGLRLDGQLRQGVAAVGRTDATLLPFSPTLPDGAVYALAIADTQLFAGGEYFTPSPEPWNRLRWGYLARIGTSSGAVAQYLMPHDTGISALTAQGTSRIYVGGSFYSVAGSSRDNLAALDGRTGALLPWGPSVYGDGVYALKLFDGRLYLGGSFSGVGAASRSNLASVESLFGALTTWDPVVDGSVHAIEVDASGVYVAGGFTRIGPTFTPHLARVLDRSWCTLPGATVLGPSIGDTVFVGTECELRWSAYGGFPRVRSVDLYLSFTGPGGPWRWVAGGLPNSGSYSWSVPEDIAPSTALLRVDARDFEENVTTAIAPGEFIIQDRATPALIEFFRAERTSEGVRIEWSIADRAGLVSIAPERGASAIGEFVRVNGEPVVESGTSRVLDRDATPGQTWWYRLAGVLRDGGSFVTAAIAAGTGGAATSFALGPLAPNPTNGGATLSFAVPMRTRVRLSLVDVQGREVALLADGERDAGRHVAMLDARDLQPGLYFVHLQSPGADLKQRLVIVR